MTEKEQMERAYRVLADAIDEYEELRAQKRYDEADKLRKELLDNLGIALAVTLEGLLIKQVYGKNTTE